MAIVSNLTAKVVMGYDPVGYVPFVTPTDPFFITTHKLFRTYDESTFIVIPPSASIADVQALFLDALKGDLDANYADTNFTDTSRNYIIDYQVVKVERSYTTPILSMWQPRTYVWDVTIQVRVNTNA